MRSVRTHATPGPIHSRGAQCGPAEVAAPLPVADEAAVVDQPTVIVICESARGHARQAANAIAQAADSLGAATLVRAIDEVESLQIAAADVVIAGCWASGKTPFGDVPSRRLADWIDDLPALSGKRVGVFCTYRLFPHTFADMAARTAKAEDRLISRFENKGGEVTGHRAIHLRSIRADAEQLVARVLGYGQAA